MGFAELIENIPKNGVKKCGVCVTIATLSAEDQEVITEAFNNPCIKSADLRRIFFAEGYEFAASTVSRHRRKECKQL